MTSSVPEKSGRWRSYELSPERYSSRGHIRTRGANEVRDGPLPHSIALPHLCQLTVKGSGREWALELLRRLSAPLTVVADDPAGLGISERMRASIAAPASAASMAAVAMSAGVIGRWGDIEGV